MKKASAFLLLSAITLTLLSLGSCKSGSKGYSDLDVLYADFVTSLKAGDNALKQYCFRITPDAGTIRYMKKKGFSYRGLPEGLEERGLDVRPSQHGRVRCPICAIRVQPRCFVRMLCHGRNHVCSHTDWTGAGTVRSGGGPGCARAGTLSTGHGRPGSADLRFLRTAHQRL